MSAPVRLSPRIGLIYAAGDIGPSLTSMCLAFYWLYFLITVGQIPPATAGAIHASGFVLSAVANLLAGHVLDGHVPEAARRARLIALFGCLTALAFALLWVVPAGGDTLVIWYLLASWAFHLFFSVVYLSYLSFAPLLGGTGNDQVDLSTYRFAGTMVLSLVMLGLYAGSEGWLPVGRRLEVLGGLVAIAGTVGALACGLMLSRLFSKRSIVARGGTMPWAALLGARGLWRGVGINLAVWLMVQTTLVLTAFLCAGARVVDGPILFVLQLSVIAGAVLASIGTRRRPVGLIFGWALVCWCAGALLWRVPMPQPAAILLGLGLGAATVLSWAAVNRSVALLSAHTGQRAEARAFAGLTVLRDMVSAIVPLVIGLMLGEHSDLAATSGLLTVAAFATALALAVLHVRPSTWLRVP
jgi:GPH family glycoside/pentoside/hexuronide:cation symporter